MTPKQAREVLKAPAGASEDELGRAYRAAVKAAHPDRGGDAEALRRVIDAHRVLEAMARGRHAFPPAAKDEARPAPRRHVLEITVGEALFGGRRRAAIAGRTLDVKLPEGLRAGETLRLAGAGGDGGDLMVRIAIAADPGLAVRGDDVWLSATAPIACGGRLEIDTPRGRRAVWLTRKVGSRRLVRLAGEGLPARDGRPAGDLIVRLETASAPAETPAREMLRRFAGAWAAACPDGPAVLTALQPCRTTASAICSA
jgi:curved DNA-binding protein